jgi:SAM-dependent methyltransferase
MDSNKVIRAILPPIVFDLKRAIMGDAVSDFTKNGSIPWSPGYARYKSQVITRMLRDNTIVELFRSGDPLPVKYGYGVDERCVEYPWLFSQLPADAKFILDAGSVLNHDFILTQPFLNGRKLHLITSAPEHNCFWRKGISYIYEDLRRLPFRDDCYDAIVCLSTLEHVGCDNTAYTAESAYSASHPNDIELVMRELKRVLKPGGTLFLSVPFGSYRNFGTFRQFDRSLLSLALAAFGDASNCAETFYRYRSDGWQLATASECAECKYVEWIAESWRLHQEPSPIPVEEDLAAAARAVACIQLVKPAAAIRCPQSATQTAEMRSLQR